MRVDFLAIGHFTRDVVPGGYTLGGSAAYSTITVRNLGLKAAAVTSVGPDFDLETPLLRGIKVHVKPAKSSTTFHNIYRDGRRIQYLLGVAEKLRGEDIPEELLEAPIVYLCPVADEVEPDVLEGFEGKLVGVTPQGWMRRWDEEGRVYPKRWEAAELILPRSDVLILSEEDISPFPEELERFRKLVGITVLTRGRKGCTLFMGGLERDFPAYEAVEVDPTGAGDVFAAAFLVKYHQTGDPFISADFANCVASFAVEAEGTLGIPSLERVMERWRFG
ncbi:ribokinase [Candidatus Poribacteria bacterium]|nr:MAG: ribokinase [Candidatus Poribacteria bacterium]